MIIASLYLVVAGVVDCGVVSADVIRMRDLAAVEPAFSNVDPEVVVGYAPLPGAIRTLPPNQLSRLARENGVGLPDPRTVCFDRAMRELNQGELHDRLDHVLDIPNARIEVVDFSRYRAPVGDLVFPRSGLTMSISPGADPLLWKGYVVYGSGHHFPVWVRVKLHATLNRVIATDNLVTNTPVRADQVRIEPLDGVPDALAPAQSLDEVVGKRLLHPVHRGATVSLDDISTAVTVRRGEKVDVQLDSPGMRIQFEAAAEMDGRYGDRIRLRNPQSNKSFEAEVSGRGQARVVLNVETDQSSASLRHSGDARDASDRRQAENEGSQ